MKGDGLAAAILIGGKSRRMGENKALLRLDPGSPTIIESVTQKLRSLASEIVLAGSDSTDYAFLGLPQVPDRMPGIGALGGIHAALTTITQSHVLVVACDMPFLSVPLLRHMAALPREYDALVPLLDRPHPLHAIYTRACLPHIEQSIAFKNFKATGWFDAATVRFIDRDEIRHLDPDLRSCFNMNTPDDLEAAKTLRGKQGYTVREADM